MVRWDLTTYGGSGNTNASRRAIQRPTLRNDETDYKPDISKGYEVAKALFGARKQ